MNVQREKEQIVSSLILAANLSRTLLKADDLYLEQLLVDLTYDRITPAEARTQMSRRLLWIADPVGHPWE